MILPLAFGCSGRKSGLIKRADASNTIKYFPVCIAHTRVFHVKLVLQSFPFSRQMDHY